MALGKGKYDDACTAVRDLTGGSVILIVTGGKHGHGFSVQSDPVTLTMVPSLLRTMAHQIEQDMQKLKQ